LHNGSTGKPKGVMVEHNGLVNLYDWYRKKSCFNRQTSVLIISSLSFDLTQKNIFSILHSGGSLIFPSYGVFSPAIIVQLIDKHKVTLLNCTPSAYYAILEAKNNTNSLHSLKTVYLGGEPINFKKVIAPELKLKIINSYGPTECSDVVTSYLIDKQDTPKNIPIGKPINNTQIYLLPVHPPVQHTQYFHLLNILPNLQSYKAFHPLNKDCPQTFGLLVYCCLSIP
jgi:non-ribosomal peptide synthetase component F